MLLGAVTHTLAHLPTRRTIATLPLRKTCAALAAELAVLEIDWQETDAERVLVGAPDQGKAASAHPAVRESHPQVSSKRGGPCVGRPSPFYAFPSITLAGVQVAG